MRHQTWMSPPLELLTRLGRVLENISIPASWYLLPPLPCPIEAG